MKKTFAIHCCRFTQSLHSRKVILIFRRPDVFFKLVHKVSCRKVIGDSEQSSPTVRSDSDANLLTLPPHDLGEVTWNDTVAEDEG